MQTMIKNIQVHAFRAKNMFELGEQITNHIENWNNNYCKEDAYKPSYIKPITVSHTVTVVKNPLPRIERYSDREKNRFKNTLIKTPFTTEVEYSAIGIFEVVEITKESAREYRLQQA